MASAVRKLRREEDRHDERLSGLTKGSSRLNDSDPASGTRRRRYHHEEDVDRLGPPSDFVEMESHVHVMQLIFLLTSLQYAWRGRKDFFASNTMTVYYPNPDATGQGTAKWKKHVFKGPDFFVVTGKDLRWQPRRRSWVIEYENGRYPDVIVEVLSRSTKKNDLGKKKDIYERIFHTHEYFLFDPDHETLVGYRLVDGRYAQIVPNAHGHFWSEKLQLALGLAYMPRLEGKFARFFTAKGDLVPLPEEDAQEAAEDATLARKETEAALLLAKKARAERKQVEERARAERKQIEDKAQRLAEKLKQLGIDPDKV